MKTVPRPAAAAAIALALALSAAEAAGQDDPGPLPLPEAWDTHYAWFLVPNPDYVRGGDADEAALQEAHVQYQLGLQVEGIALSAGGFGAGGGTEAAGMTILRVVSLDEARRIAADDPAVKAGKLLAEVKEWWVPAGSLHGGVREGVRADEVRDFVDTHRVALSRRDTAALRTMYAEADRFAWYEDGVLRYDSVEELLAGLQSFPAGMQLDTRYDDVRIVPLGGAAAHVATGFETTVGQGSDAFSFAGRISMALERRVGLWRIVSGHTSTAPSDPRR